MKKDAVSMRPTETMMTASDGYHSTGTGLEIAFAACHRNHSIGVSQNHISRGERDDVRGLTIPPDLPPLLVVVAFRLDELTDQWPDCPCPTAEHGTLGCVWVSAALAGFDLRANQQSGLC